MKTTINLLPPEKKQEMRSAFVFAYVQSILVLVLVMTLIMSATLVSVRLLLGSTYDSLTEQTGTDTEEYMRISEEIVQINDYIERTDDLTAQQVSWSAVIDNLVTLLPEGVVLNRIAVSPKGRVVFAGTAVRRDDVLAIDDRLKASQSFTDVKSPLSNILQRDNVQFEFDVQYAPLAAMDEGESAN